MRDIVLSCKNAARCFCSRSKRSKSFHVSTNLFGIFTDLPSRRFAEVLGNIFWQASCQAVKSKGRACRAWRVHSLSVLSMPTDAVCDRRASPHTTDLYLRGKANPQELYVMSPCLVCERAFPRSILEAFPQGRQQREQRELVRPARSFAGPLLALRLAKPRSRRLPCCMFCLRAEILRAVLKF